MDNNVWRGVLSSPEAIRNYHDMAGRIGGGQQLLALRNFVRPVEPSMKNPIANGAIWSIIGAGFASGLAMVSNVACARMLGATSFGELGIVMATTNLFTTVFTSGLSMTANGRDVAEYRDADPIRAGKVIGLSTVTSMVVGLVIALLMRFRQPHH